MPYCPVCRAEYMPGVKVCAEDGVRLVAFLPPEPVEEDEWEIVYTTMQDYDAEMIRARLGEEGILARVLSKADHALGIGIGDLAIVHVYVHADDVKDAKRIISEEDTIDPEMLGDIPDIGDE